MGIITLINNLRYLFRYNIKEIYCNQKDIMQNQNSLKINDSTLCLIEKIMSDVKNNWDEIFVPKIRNNFETIETLIKYPKSIIRFGDGEFRLIENDDIPFQDSSNILSKKLLEILDSEDENLLIGLPYEYYKSNVCLRNSNRKFLYSWVPLWLKHINKYLKNSNTYYSTSISQVYAMYEKYDFEKHFHMLKQIWNDKKITIITGDRVLNNINNNIFSNAKEINYVYGPTKNAFEKYEELKNKLLKLSQDQILIFAIGPAGKVLAYECFKNGYRVLDLGHVIKDYDTYKKNNLMDEKEIIKFFSPD